MICTEEEYNIALKQLDVVWDAEEGTPEGDLLGQLLHDICDYENEHYPIGLPDPIESIKIRLEDLNLEAEDLPIDLAVLEKERTITPAQAQSLSDLLGLPMEVLEQLTLEEKDCG